MLEYVFALTVDRGVLLSDIAFAGSDTLATARILTGGIIKLGAYDLILCGNESADGATRQTPAQIAEFLDIPCVSSVNNISFIDEKTLLVEKKQIMAHSLFK